MAEQLRPLGSDTVLLIIDMQRMFAEHTEWRVPEIDRLLGPILKLQEGHAEATLFTRFIPPRSPAEASSQSWFAIEVVE